MTDPGSSGGHSQSYSSSSEERGETKSCDMQSVCEAQGRLQLHTGDKKNCGLRCFFSLLLLLLFFFFCWTSTKENMRPSSDTWRPQFYPQSCRRLKETNE
ncbi:hypothetical protein JOB18_047719 [Solea senegalensis]|uniref:Uncharacterized protein n=1 Tax=Solea senegalensis TaxID=28829 RepID=A0AAV6S1L6_SOLSE|nr:hypothetical protein JOB18_047719 [Solea senegalensis]